MIALLPFLSEARVARDPEADAKRSSAPHVDGDAARYAAARLAAEARARADVRHEGLPHVLVMHQYVTGGLPSDSERRLRVGALSDLDASSIPAGLDYVALGHLHRPQEVVGAASPSFYAGSPIAYSFSEAGQDKRAILVEALGRSKPAKVRDVRLTSGRALEIWPVRSIEEARERAGRSSEHAPIVDVRADFGRRLGGAEAEALFTLPNVSVASVRDLFVPIDAPREIAIDDGADAPVEELFRELYKRRIGKDPDDADVAELVSGGARGRSRRGGQRTRTRRCEGGGARLKLVKLAMRGLRSFADPTEIDFARLGEQGLFAIVGPTGAGKSTVLDGVFLALFGKSPRGEASDCVAPGATELFVRLEIILRDPHAAASPELAIERRWRWSKKRDASETEVRGAPRHAPVRVEQKVGDGWQPIDFAGLAPEAFLRERIVKISIGDFQQAVVLPQGEFGALLGARPKERRQLVASLFRTEHLGEPLALVLRQRESEVKGEIERLGEAQREVSVSEEDAEAARQLAASSAETARALQLALAARGTVRDGGAASARAVRQARDEANDALAVAEAEAAHREIDRARAALARRAAGAAGAVDELDAAEASAADADAEDREAKRAAQEATATLRAAQRELADARAARDLDLDAPLWIALEKARSSRSNEAARDRRSRRARRAAPKRSPRPHKPARRPGRRSTRRPRRSRSGATRQRASRRSSTSGRASTRPNAPRRSPRSRGRAARRGDAAGGASTPTSAPPPRAPSKPRSARPTRPPSNARAAEAAFGDAATDLARLEVDAARATAEIEIATRTLDDARRAEAAADLAERLRDGMPCPVCGAREHPGVDHRGPSAWLAAAERTVDAARRTAAFMAKLRDEAGGARARVGRGAPRGDLAARRSVGARGSRS